jgi:hypothetical protein
MWFLGSGSNARRCLRGPEALGARPLPRARLAGLWPPLRSVGDVLRSHGSLYPDKNHVKISAQSELRIFGYLRNGERPENGDAKQKRNRDVDPISEGLWPLHHHGGHGPEGKPSFHLGGRTRKKKKEGGSLSPSLPVAPEHRWGHHRDGNLHQQPRYRQHQLSPPLCSGVTPLLPAVIST